MTPSTSSRFRSISSLERASRLRRSSGSVFDGRTFKCHIGHRHIELSRDEVALAVRFQDLRELLPLLRDELEHEQERYDTRICLREVPEVVMARHLAGERGVFLSHAVLDE